MDTHSFPSINKNRKIGSLIKTSTVDFPGCISAALFLHGCNLRCPYCYNIDLVTGKLNEEEAFSFNEVIAHLEKRKKVLSGFVISGGEPSISPYLPHLLKEAKEIGYKTKLDTNGMKPSYLESILANPKISPDYIALDVKTRPEKYHLLGGAHAPMGEESAGEKIQRSIEILASLPSEKREFRTVLVPGLVNAEDVKEIAHLLPKDASWFFAEFRNDSCIDPAYNKIEAYEKKELDAIIHQAQLIIPKAALR